MKPTSRQPGDAPTPPPATRTGRIDVHSHLLPGLDDGCQSAADSLACVRRLQDAGFVGTICTPHICLNWCSDNTPRQIADRVDKLRQRLAEEGVDYALWAGGELRLFNGVIDWMKQHGVPTLAGSRCVLTDLWSRTWPQHVFPTFQWLLDEGYQPILAHPERMVCLNGPNDPNLQRAEAMGVWLQGNANCFTEKESGFANQMVRALLGEGRYRLLALDMHGPDTLDSRLNGLKQAAVEFSHDTVSRLIEHAPRELILQGDAPDQPRS